MLLFILAVLPALVRAFSWSAYDVGFHGIYPTQKHVSVDSRPPSPKITHWDSRCDSGKILLSLVARPSHVWTPDVQEGLSMDGLSIRAGDELPSAGV